MSSSCKFRVSMDEREIKIKLPKISEKTRRKKETSADKTKMKEEKGKRDFNRSKTFSPVKKMTSAIFDVFNRKKTTACGNRYDSAEITDADETLLAANAKPKQNPLQKNQNFWKSARIRLKILFLGKRLKTRRSSSDGTGEEELCKKRILMGERCKPVNRSGLLQYDCDGVILPEP